MYVHSSNKSNIKVTLVIIPGIYKIAVSISFKFDLNAVCYDLFDLK